MHIENNSGYFTGKHAQETSIKNFRAHACERRQRKQGLGMPRVGTMSKMRGALHKPGMILQVQATQLAASEVKDETRKKEMQERREEGN